ncbi:MAG: glucose-1-phosphate cytidylyltransferase [Candidatus Scalindua rubra]|uniref:Glucose-1-phosphate cytidylyltransferase n=1 Tax=Candidatus Scalindua brodae TaxID=237368 RepID=A0A0B0ETU1_9BACT|nr:MAG: glucose-1-phosphate cytidylyltransferase [Candidatus Scalindua brodae]MBZ0109658.1 glucose-1-phosphate cytidylyltransferase [Candidatus Scalindua rubra]TWU33087.1 Glucose-1-phosphate cytidylyltransferase [Candidatus Brocadiaceae bacterium S225]
MKVVILCGGQGTRLREETEIKPKPMVEIGGMPILWHIMKTYSCYGFKEFILCLGYKGNVIKEYFYNYEMISNDFTIELGTNDIKIHPRHSEHGWKITLVDTGLNAMTGARLKRIERFINEDRFMLTYGDGVTGMNMMELLSFHKKHGNIGTVTGASPPSRYGELSICKDRVISFSEKPTGTDNKINGGYFIFEKEFFKYLNDEDNCILEKAPLEKLALDNELKVFNHKGFWQCMDTYRDFRFLEELWDSGKAPWKVWDE